MLHILPKVTNIDFMKPRRIAMAISGLVILAGIISMIIQGGPNYGIDFKGGLAVTMRFEIPKGGQAITEGNIRKTLAAIGMNNAEVKMSRSTQGEDFLIHIMEEGRYRPPEALIRGKLDEQFGEKWRPAQADQLNMKNLPALSGLNYVAIMADFPRPDLERMLGSIEIDVPKIYETITVDSQKVFLLTGEGKDSVSKLRKAIIADYPNNNFEIRSIDRVGPRIGQELRSKSIWATIFVLLLIIVYLWFRFEFLFGVAAVISVFHDVLVALALMSFLKMEISLTVVGAFLTLVGYSINDTIVVYDRIRENIKRYKDKTFSDVVNLSINQTLSRTIITNGATMLVVIALFFLGGEVLKGFSFVLLCAGTVGSYSSVYIAAPILVEYAERTGREAGKKLGK